LRLCYTAITGHRKLPLCEAGNREVLDLSERF
jgi:hypothetical protein